MKTKFFFLSLFVTIGIITLLATSNSFSSANAQITDAFNELTIEEKVNYLENKFNELKDAFDNPTKINKNITDLENRILELESTSNSCDGSIEMVKILSKEYTIFDSSNEEITHHTSEELFVIQYDGFCVVDVNVHTERSTSSSDYTNYHVWYVVEYAKTS